MKEGSFVGKGCLKLSKEEIKAIKAQFKLISFSIPIEEIKWKLTPSYDKKGDMLCAFVSLKQEMRRSNKTNDLFCVDFIKLDVIKQYGYLEREHGRFYEWKDGFQPPYDKTSFQCRIDIIGNSRNYRCRNICRGGIGQTQFTYGTEIEDLEISKGIEYVKIFLKNTHIDPKAKPFY